MYHSRWGHEDMASSRVEYDSTFLSAGTVAVISQIADRIRHAGTNLRRLWECGRAFTRGRVEVRSCEGFMADDPLSLQAVARAGVADFGRGPFPLWPGGPKQTWMMKERCWWQKVGSV